MTNTVLTAKKYRIWKNGETLGIEGSIRPMNDEDSDPIQKILDEVAQSEMECLNLDLTALKFLNSSGINMLCKFAMKLRGSQIANVTVLGTNEITWQAKSLGNLKGLNPDLKLQMVG